MHLILIVVLQMCLLFCSRVGGTRSSIVVLMHWRTMLFSVSLTFIYFSYGLRSILSAICIYSCIHYLAFGVFCINVSHVKHYEQTGRLINVSLYHCFCHHTLHHPFIVKFNIRVCTSFLAFVGNRVQIAKCPVETKVRTPMSVLYKERTDD